ncbi:histidinol-phosphate transaminase [Candidatus Omnitrophota bacterium]
MKSLARKSILRIKSYQPGKPAEEVRRELGLKKVYKMASNESPFGPSKKVLSAITSATKTLNRYPDGSCFYLRRKLAKKLKVKEEQLIFGNGSDEIIVFAARAFLEPGDEIIIADKTFLIYEIAGQACAAKIVKIRMKDFRYDLKAMKQAITKKTKIVFIANPDNPNGTYVTDAEVKEFFRGLRNDLIVYFDEAYFEIFDKKNFPNTMKLLQQGRNIIITRTFSKAYSLAGLRIGYGISSLAIISLLNRVREPFNVNSIAQAAALASLSDATQLRKTKKAIRAGKQYLYSQFGKMGLRYVDSCTNFVLVDVKKNSTLVFRKLLGQGIIVRDMKAWGLNTFIRVTVSTMKENRAFIAALRRIV